MERSIKSGHEEPSFTGAVDGPPAQPIRLRQSASSSGVCVPVAGVSSGSSSSTSRISCIGMDGATVVACCSVQCRIALLGGVEKERWDIISSGLQANLIGDGPLRSRLAPSRDLCRTGTTRRFDQVAVRTDRVPTSRRHQALPTCRVLSSTALYSVPYSGYIQYVLYCTAGAASPRYRVGIQHPPAWDTPHLIHPHPSALIRPWHAHLNSSDPHHYRAWPCH
jgi:hypothetical protein